MQKFRLGCRPDEIDKRDFQFKSQLTQKNFPIALDHRQKFFRAWDQGELGSCTAQAAAAACMYLDIFDRDMDIVTPSRLFIYYATRSLEKTVGVDVGATIRNTIKAIALWGYPPEAQWPYDPKKFAETPSSVAQQLAVKEKISRYERVARDLNQFREILCQGYPILVGFSVYESVYSEGVRKSGVIPLPARGSNLDGRHAILICGYDDAKRQFVFRNSWGEDWGERGYGYLPYDYIERQSLSADFWTIR